MHSLRASETAEQADHRHARAAASTSSSQPFGGAALFLVGNFRQTFPIVPKSHPDDEIEACIKHSHLWHFVQTRTLTINMCSILHQQEGDDDYATKLLNVGNGNLPMDANGLADISSIGNYVSGREDLCRTVYPDLSTPTSVTNGCVKGPF
uniref:ATP-dependent DNA helicase n=1 Tax=Octopus bimaculoides TaxID=37653 RepID=A0A0L8FHT0_OCTBM